MVLSLNQSGPSMYTVTEQPRFFLLGRLFADESSVDVVSGMSPLAHRASHWSHWRACGPAGTIHSGTMESSLVETRHVVAKCLARGIDRAVKSLIRYYQVFSANAVAPAKLGPSCSVRDNDRLSSRAITMLVMEK